MQTLVLVNENVKRRTLPNGQPAPQPYPTPIHLDIVAVMLAMYTGWCLSSLVIAAVLTSFLNTTSYSPYFNFDCKDYMGTWTYTILTMVTLSSVISMIITIKLALELRR